MAKRKNPSAVKLGALGWANLSKERRSELAKAAIKARWDRRRAEKEQAERDAIAADTARFHAAAEKAS